MSINMHSSVCLHSVVSYIYTRTHTHMSINQTKYGEQNILKKYIIGLLVL